MRSTNEGKEGERKMEREGERGEERERERAGAQKTPPKFCPTNLASGAFLGRARFFYITTSGVLTQTSAEKQPYCRMDRHT